MSRVVWFTAIAVLAFGAFSARPPDAPSPSAVEPTLLAPSAAGCIVSVGRGQSGAVAVTGEATVTVDGELRTLGSGALGIESVAPSGAGSALVEFVGPGSAAIVESDELMNVAGNCSPTTTEPLVLSGISTANGRQVELVVSNPYALDAIIDISSSSEVGTDTASELESLVVPAGGIAVRDLSRILPLRRHLSLVLTPRRGAIHAVVFETGPEDGRVSEAVAGADEWWALFPPIEGLVRHLTIAGVSLGAVPFQLDIFSTEGLVEAAIDDSVPSGAQFDLIHDEIATAQAVRVVAAGAVVAAISLEGEGTLAGGPAALSAATVWGLPGAGVLPGASTVWIFNPGAEPASLTLTPIGTGNPTGADVLAVGLVGVPVARASAGYVLVSDRPVVAVWTAAGTGLAYAAGVPLDG